MRKLQSLQVNIRVKSIISAPQDVKKSLMLILKNTRRNKKQKKPIHNTDGGISWDYWTQ